MIGIVAFAIEIVLFAIVQIVIGIFVISIVISMIFVIYHAPVDLRACNPLTCHGVV